MIFRFSVGPGIPSTPIFMETMEDEGGFPPIVAHTPEEEFMSISVAMRDVGWTDTLADADASSPAVPPTTSVEILFQLRPLRRDH